MLFERLFIDSVSELIDKCVGSKIWVIMKGDKGVFNLCGDLGLYEADFVHRIQWYSHGLR